MTLSEQERAASPETSPDELISLQKIPQRDLTKPTAAAPLFRGLQSMAQASILCRKLLDEPRVTSGEPRPKKAARTANEADAAFDLAEQLELVSDNLLGEMPWEELHKKYRHPTLPEDGFQIR